LILFYKIRYKLLDRYTEMLYFFILC